MRKQGPRSRNRLQFAGSSGQLGAVSQYSKSGDSRAESDGRCWSPFPFPFLEQTKGQDVTGVLNKELTSEIMVRQRNVERSYTRARARTDARTCARAQPPQEPPPPT